MIEENLPEGRPRLFFIFAQTTAVVDALWQYAMKSHSREIHFHPQRAHRL
ncbi:MAG TPA: hypothetical protein VD840_09490 [Sinorhizobium sp.]|nr:hypothetical protein [Sinorhizobium sp.]